jgi:hypothetical protein
MENRNWLVLIYQIIITFATMILLVVMLDKILN